MATGGDNQSLPFPARERSDDTDDEAQPGVPERSLILEHQCSEASDCSDKDRAKLLVGTRLTDFQIPRLDSYENQEVSVSLGTAHQWGHHDDSQMKEMREALELLQIEVGGLRQAIDSKNEELVKKTEELKEAREEKNQLLKRLQWKDEDLEHERKSRQWMETELNHKIALLEHEKDELQKTIKDLKGQMDTMQMEMQVMNNQKASVEDFTELQQKVERLSNRDCDFPKPKAMASLEKYTLEFVKNVSSLMQPQGEAALASYKNGGNGHHQSSDTNNDEGVINNGHGETRHGTVHRTTSDGNNA